MTATAEQLEAMKFYVSKGYTRDGSGAIVGNLSQESGVHLNSKFMLTTDHGSQGIAQWRLDRLTKLEQFANETGMVVTDLTTQMLYLIWELENIRIYQALNVMLKTGGRSLATLTANFMTIFERPAAQYANLNNRIKQANVCVAAYAADLAPAHPIGEVIAAGGVTGTAGAGAIAAWSAGLSGPLIAGIATLAVLAFLVFAVRLAQHRKQAPAAVPATPSGHLTPIEELKAAMAEMAAAHDRVDAATALLVADRQEGDRLLEAVKTLRGIPLNG